MSNPEERMKHSKRIQKKRVAKARSVIAKELIVNNRYKQKIVPGKKGKLHNLDKMTHADLVKAISED